MDKSSQICVILWENARIHSGFSESHDPIMATKVYSPNYELSVEFSPVPVIRIGLKGEPSVF